MAGLEGKTLHHYELRRLVGRGGMADVYEALDLTNQRTVAVKVFKREDEEMLQRFIREAKLMRSLNNPHLVPVFDSGTGQVDGVPCSFIVMPFLPGGTLRTRIRRGGAMPLNEVCRDMKDIASALDYIHSQGIIHRDIKASNVLLNADGRCYLSDFGIARIASEATQLTSTGNVLGTVDYVAPELFEVHRRADALSDLYSLGVLLYEMVTGKLPFSAENQIALVSMHMNKQPPPPHSIAPHVSPGVERVMLRALEKKPEMRYGSATELANAFCGAVAASSASGVAPQGVGAGESQGGQAPLVLPAVDAGQPAPVNTPFGARDVPIYDYATVVGAAPYAAGTPPAQGVQGYQGIPAAPGATVQRPPSSPTPGTRRSRSNYQRRQRIIVTVLALVTLLIVIVPSIYLATHQSPNPNPTSTPTQAAVSSPSAAASPTVTPSPTPNLTATAQAAAAMTATAQAHATQTAIAGVTATASAKASATAGVIQTATAGTPTYEDALNNAASAKTQTASWDGIDGNNSNCAFKSDGYHVTEANSLRGCRESGHNYTNATISVDVVMVSGMAGGIFFRVKTVPVFGAYSGYLFEIDSTGRYRIIGSDNFNLNPTQNVLQDWTASSALKTGYNVKNTLQVIMNGSTLLFYANGVFLKQVQDSTYTSGNIALGAFASGGNTEVVYSNIKVYPLS